MFSLEPVNDQNHKLLAGKITIANGVLYNTNVFNEENIIYLTKNGEFHQYGPLNSNYGYEMGKVEFDGLVLKISIHSPIQSQGFIKTITNKEINLEGENVLVSIDPELNWQISEPIYSKSTLNNATLQKLKSIQNLKFPTGAKCLQTVTEHLNQEYLQLEVSSQNYKSQFEIILDDYNQQQNGASSIKYNPISKFTQFFGSTTYLNQYDEGYTLYNGKYYTTEKKDLGFDFVHAEFIQDSIDEANHFKDPVEKAARLNYAESYKKECDLYNAVAADFIKKNIKL